MVANEPRSVRPAPCAPVAPVGPTKPRGPCAPVGPVGPIGAIFITCQTLPFQRQVFVPELNS